MESTYMILPTSSVREDLVLWLDTLLEYDIDLDYVLSLMSTVTDAGAVVGFENVLQNFSGLVSEDILGLFIDAPGFIDKCNNDLDLLASVVECLCNALETICLVCWPILSSITNKPSLVKETYHFNFIRWVGDDIMVVVTTHRAN